ncbi:MAG: hypothetical protein GWN71_19085 [Gammaproteobacteria bacterium]|nr:hypothetical protein [Actinomycetota bacterium]NIU75600.1 hypothetical protein [Gammaproteobacteria bacterium]
MPADENTAANPSRSYAEAVYSCPPQVVGETYQVAAETDRCAMGPSGIRLHDFVSNGTAAAEVRVFGAPAGRLIVSRLK